MRSKDHKFLQAQFANNFALAATCRIKICSLAFFTCSIPSILCSTYKTFHSTVLALGPTPPTSLPLAPFLSTVAWRQQQYPLCGPGAAGKETPSSCFYSSIFSVSQSQLSWPTQLGSNGRRSRKRGEEQRQEHLCKRQQEFDTSNICQ